jgi:hypothetical protein
MVTKKNHCLEKKPAHGVEWVNPIEVFPAMMDRAVQQWRTGQEDYSNIIYNSFGSQGGEREQNMKSLA